MDNVDSSGCSDVGIPQPIVDAGSDFHGASQCKGGTPFSRLRVYSRADLGTGEEITAKIRSLKGEREPES